MILPAQGTADTPGNLSMNNGQQHFTQQQADVPGFLHLLYPVCLKDGLPYFEYQPALPPQAAERESMFPGKVFFAGIGDHRMKPQPQSGLIAHRSLPFPVVLLFPFPDPLVT
jgi:hypothetical protein